VPCEAARILQSVDETVDPCSDFFEFACGQWNRRHPIPDERTKYDMFVMLNDELQGRLKSAFVTSATFGGVLLSTLCVCLSVCLSVCSFVNTITQQVDFHEI